MSAVRSEMLDLTLRESREVHIDKAGKNLLGFTTWTKPDFEINWHHKVTARAVTKWIRREIPNIMIFMPPRVGKTEVVSRRTPAFILGRQPNAKIIATSYADSLASANNRDVQRCIDTDDYRLVFPQTTLSGENVRSNVQGSWLRNNDIFEIVGYRGAYKSAGCGSGITGLGFNYGIIDDPFKDWKEADSPTIRQARWDWYTSTFYSRKEKGAGICLVMTRWHEDDLAARILAGARKSGEKWVVVAFPMLKEEGTKDVPYADFMDAEFLKMDPRKPGEPLWPNKYSLEDCHLIRGSVGDRIWNGLYQQRPSNPGGNIFKRAWLQNYWNKDTLPKWFDQMLISVDCTFKETNDSDYVAMGVWGKRAGDFYLIDQIRERMGIIETMAAIRSLSVRYPRAMMKAVEDKANGSAVIEMLRKEIPGMVAIEPEGSKESRANAVAPAFQSGNVFLPDPVLNPWVSDYQDELVAFPKGANDDQVDQTTQALIRMGASVNDILAQLTKM